MTALPHSTEKKLGLVIDLDTCVGCQACVTACKGWNDQGQGLSDQDAYGANPSGTFLNRVHSYQVSVPDAPAQIVTFPRSCLHCENADTLNELSGFLQITFGRLDEAHTVFGVLLSAAQAVDLCTHFFRNRETGCIVTTAVDTHTARQLFHIFIQRPVLELQHAVRVDRRHIVIDNHLFPP